VLVDNGRSQRLGMKDFWYSLKCIRCGACMNTCPVYRRSGGLSYGATYSGPIGIIIDPAFHGQGSPACVRSGISGWRDRALYPLAAGRRAARRIMVGRSWPTAGPISFWGALAILFAIPRARGAGRFLFDLIDGSERWGGGRADGGSRGECRRMGTAWPPRKGARGDQEAPRLQRVWISSGGRNGIQQLGSHAKRRSLGLPVGQHSR
jgi:ferredoxin